ncbi:MAG: hypothetical protein ACKO38_08090 [Planctomycetota bacterium]
MLLDGQGPTALGEGLALSVGELAPVAGLGLAPVAGTAGGGGVVGGWVVTGGSVGAMPGAG